MWHLRSSQYWLLSFISVIKLATLVSLSILNIILCIFGGLLLGGVVSFIIILVVSFLVALESFKNPSSW